VGSKKWLLRQLPAGVRECEERYTTWLKEQKFNKATEIFLSAIHEHRGIIVELDDLWLVKE